MRKRVPVILLAVLCCGAMLRLAGKDREVVLAADAAVSIPESKYVALTFDDGPRAGTTDVLLDGLYERGIPATFFLVGEQIGANADLVRRMAAEGHQVGNHTQNHVRLAEATDAEVTAAINSNQKA